MSIRGNGSKQVIIIDICGRPGTAECEGDGEGDKDSGPSQQNLEKRELGIGAGFKVVIGRKGLLSKNLEKKENRNGSWY